MTVPQKTDQLPLEVRRADVGVAGVTVRLGYLLRLLQQRSFRDHETAFGARGLNPAKHAMLTLIRANPGIMQVQLGDVLGIHGPNVTNLVKQLKQDGLVSRKRSTEDARAFGLNLTPHGEAAVTEIEELADAVDRKCVSSLTDIELTVLKMLLHKALNNGAERIADE